ncbi:MAG TPA: hypothetical protein VFY93_14050 [Planctomycetota bacterium]|nr:hypothetical protein [Planctomycetota bacterium]
MRRTHYLARCDLRSIRYVFLAGLVSACASTSSRSHTTAFVITSASPEATVYDLRGDVVGDCPLEGRIRWEEVVRLARVSGAESRQLDAVGGETGLIELEARGRTIRVFLAGTIKTPGTGPRGFRECIGCCSPVHTELEERVEISAEPPASLPAE